MIISSCVLTHRLPRSQTRTLRQLSADVGPVKPDSSPRLSSRCRLRRGLGRPLHCRHLRLAQRRPQQTHLPPLHHGDRHLQHPGGLPGGHGHDNQREPGGRVAAVASFLPLFFFATTVWHLHWCFVSSGLGEKKLNVPKLKSWRMTTLMFFLSYMLTFETFCRERGHLDFCFVLYNMAVKSTATFLGLCR